MEAADVVRATEAALAIAATLGLCAETATVLQNSNKVALRLLPADTLARIAPVAHDHARVEVELARRMAEAGCPVATLDRRVASVGHRRDGFEVTFWTFEETVAPGLAPAAYAEALAQLHAGLRSIDVATPHALDRAAEAQRAVADRARTPQLADTDRDLLATTLAQACSAVQGAGAAEQLLHGEPHSGNVLATAEGPRFIDLETCCRGPVEFDLAHVPEPVADRYPGVDATLLGHCRQLVLAMVATWRWEVRDQLPDGLAFGRALLAALRTGPPWPPLDQVHRSLDRP